MLSNEEVYLLAALRSHTVRGIKMNSKSLYQSNPYCPLECNSANESALPLDSLFECPGIVIDSQDLVSMQAEYKDIYSKDVAKQKLAVSTFEKLLNKRNSILEKRNQPVDSGPKACNSAV